MTKYAVRVDSSLYHADEMNTVAVAYEIVNETEGRVVKEGSWGSSTDNIDHSEEAELLGIHRAMFAMSRIDTGSPVVVYVYCDCDRAIQCLKEGENTLGSEKEILDLTEQYHTVKWHAVSGDEVYDLDTEAARERNRIRHSY